MIWLGSKVNSVSFSPTQAYSVRTLLGNKMETVSGASSKWDLRRLPEYGAGFGRVAGQIGSTEGHGLRDGGIDQVLGAVRRFGLRWLAVERRSGHGHRRQGRADGRERIPRRWTRRYDRSGSRITGTETRVALRTFRRRNSVAQRRNDTQRPHLKPRRSRADVGSRSVTSDGTLRAQRLRSGPQFSCRRTGRITCPCGAVSCCWRHRNLPGRIVVGRGLSRRHAHHPVIGRSSGSGPHLSRWWGDSTTGIHLRRRLVGGRWRRSCDSCRWSQIPRRVGWFRFTFEYLIQPFEKRVN